MSALPIAAAMIVAVGMGASRASLKTQSTVAPPPQGAVCKFDQTYRLGNTLGNTYDVSVSSAEYSATRVKTSATCIFPKADTKLLVVHFTVTNPRQEEQWYQSAIKFKAIMNNGAVAESKDAWVEAPPKARLDFRLQPDQTLACYSIIEVPGVGQVDKLVVSSGYDTATQSATYAMTGLIKKLDPPYADPADPTGTTPLKIMKVGLGPAYQLGGMDVAVLKVEQVEGSEDPLPKLNPGDIYVLVTYQATNFLEEGRGQGAFGGSWMSNALFDTDGGSIGAANSGNIRPTRLAGFDPTTLYGEPVTFRKSYIIKKGTQVSYVRLIGAGPTREIRYYLTAGGNTDPGGGGNPPGKIDDPGKKVEDPGKKVEDPGKKVEDPAKKDDKKDTPVWGVADLHAHPAAHLAFGADDNGKNGMFWGSPGMALANAQNSVLSDLPACSDDSHYGFDLDLVKKNVRSSFITMLDSLTGWTHGKGGAPGFEAWPSAESVNHQQMHILAVRRAYEGGLRLMIASVLDNQMLSNMWSKMGRPANLASMADFMKPDPNREMNSAKKQIAFIKQMAAANSDWMQVVKTPGEARAAIRANKLALILGVEMDSLTIAQITDLIRNYDVRQVIPIHLANNPSFGGTAVYEDAFNTNNLYLNGKFFEIASDPTLKFTLGRPQLLAPAMIGAINGVGGLYSGAWEPKPVTDAEYARLGYANMPGGHINAMRLVPWNFQALMKEGVMIDLAHMGERTAQDALTIAEGCKYPLMDTHTGIRADDSGENERDLSKSFAKRLGALGGVLGLGTMGDKANHVLISQKRTGTKEDDNLFRFTGDLHDYSPPFQQVLPDAGKVIYKLRLTLDIGNDGLSDGDLKVGFDPADVVITFKNGDKKVIADISKGKVWQRHVTKTVDLPLPGGTKVGDLSQITIHGNGKGGIAGDNWNIDRVLVAAVLMESDCVTTWINEYDDAMQTLGGRGVGLGTDFNGLSPQMPYAAQDVPFPFQAPQPDGATTAATQMYACLIGSRTYSLSRDGIAHYGMLADFLQAIKLKPNGAAAYKALFQSADDVIKMWEKAVLAGRSLNAGGSSPGGPGGSNTIKP